MMKSKNSKIAMNMAGAMLLVLSSMAFAGANYCKNGVCKTRKTIKKTAQKFANVVDTVVDAI